METFKELLVALLILLALAIFGNVLTSKNSVEQLEPYICPATLDRGPTTDC